MTTKVNPKAFEQLAREMADGVEKDGEKLLEFLKACGKTMSDLTSRVAAIRRELRQIKGN